MDRGGDAVGGGGRAEIRAHQSQSPPPGPFLPHTPSHFGAGKGVWQSLLGKWRTTRERARGTPHKESPKGVRNILNSKAENSEKQVLGPAFSVLIHPLHFQFFTAVFPSVLLPDCPTITVEGALTTEDKRRRNLPDFGRGWWEKLSVNI